MIQKENSPENGEKVRNRFEEGEVTESGSDVCYLVQPITVKQSTAP